MFQMRSDGRTTFVRGDVALEGDGSRNWFDGREVDTDDNALVRRAFRSNLTP